MMVDLLLILLCLTVFSGVVTFVDYLLRGHTKTKEVSVLVDYCRSLFPVFLIVLLLRSFVAQPYRVPSGSLEPSVIPGDFIVVTQYNYGVYLPVWRKKILSISHPQRGQVALFYWPVDSKVTFVKRVIGVPGDTISYVNKVLTINGKVMTQQYVGDEIIREGNQYFKMSKYEENLNGLKHGIYVCAPDILNCPSSGNDFYNLKIPPGYYMMMGDNRDDSDDSRDWGLVPENALVGRAVMILMNWNSDGVGYKKIRWNRIGTML